MLPEEDHAVFHFPAETGSHPDKSLCFYGLYKSFFLRLFLIKVEHIEQKGRFPLRPGFIDPDFIA